MLRRLPHYARQLFLGALALLLLAAFSSRPAQAQNKTIYVDNSVAPGGDGSSWESAYKYLQDALDGANATPDATALTVQIAEGLYYPDEDEDGDQTNDDESAYFLVEHPNITVLGGFPSGGGARDPSTHLTILSGDIAQQDAMIPPSEGITENQKYAYYGYSSEKLLHISGVPEYETLVFDGLVITGQYGSESAIYFNARTAPDYTTDPGCYASFRNLIVAGNLSEKAPLVVAGCSFEVSNARFFGNKGTGVRNAGAISFWSGYGDFDRPVEITNVSFENNEGDAGVFRIENNGNQNTFNLTNVTFDSNEGAYYAAVYTDNVPYGELTFSNVIFRGNVENDALKNDVWVHSSGDDTYPIFENTISDVELPATIQKKGTTLVGDAGLTFDPQETGTEDDSGNPAPRRYMNPPLLAEGSPAINAGDETLLPADAADIDGDGNTTEPSPLDAQGNVRVISSAVDMGAFESNSTAGSFSGGGPSLAAPEGFVAAAGDGEVSLSWSAVDGASAYNVYRSTVAFTSVETATQIASGVSATSYVDEAASNGQTYYYAVTATDGSAESDPTATQEATPQDTTAPSLADDLAATAGEEAVSLSWSASSDGDLAGYNLYRAESSFTAKGEATKVNAELVTATSYDDAGLMNGQAYYYRYTAVDAAGNESGLSAEASATPQDVTAPAAPSGVMATAGEGQVDLAWNASAASDLDGYNLYRATSSFSDKADATLVNQVDVLSGVSYSDQAVTNGEEYYYRLTAVDGAGNESALSAEVSATPADKTPPDALTTLSATAGKGKVDLSWSESDAPDKAGYNLYRAKSSFSDVSSATKINESGLITAATYADLSAESSFQYFYRVTVVDEAGNESGLSNEASATPEAEATPDATPPAKPSGLVAAGADERVSLSWNAGSEDDLAGYNVYRSESAFTDKTDATKANAEGLGVSAPSATAATSA